MIFTIVILVKKGRCMILESAKAVNRCLSSTTRMLIHQNLMAFSIATAYFMIL